MVIVVDIGQQQQQPCALDHVTALRRPFSIAFAFFSEVFVLSIIPLVRPHQRAVAHERDSTHTRTRIIMHSHKN